MSFVSEDFHVIGNIMIKKLILLDIDGTLIGFDHNFNVSPELLQKEIDALKKAKWLLGINSNRAFEDMQDIYEQLHLNGPLLVENGIYIKETLTRAPEMLIKSCLPI